MLHLLVDTSALLDLAKRRDGQKWIVAFRLNVLWGNLQLLVPTLIVDEFERNRPRIEASMTASVAERFRQNRQKFNEYGGEEDQTAIEALKNLAHQVPLIGAMTTRNLDELLEMMRSGGVLETTDEQRYRVVQRALDKQAPFHRSRNSVAGALLIEMYATAERTTPVAVEPDALPSGSGGVSRICSGRRMVVMLPWAGATRETVPRAHCATVPDASAGRTTSSPRNPASSGSAGAV